MLKKLEDKWQNKSSVNNLQIYFLKVLKKYILLPRHKNDSI